MLRRILSIAVGAIVMAGCGGDRTAPPAPASQSPLSGTTLDREQVSLADFRGTPLFVNVWSSW